MYTISKTDNAYASIDKINANFDELKGGTTKIAAEGSLTGSGSTFAYAYFDAVPGTMLHFDFGGNWADVSGVGSSYAKLAIGFRNSSGTRKSMMIVYMGSEIQTAGYDVFLSPGYGADYQDMYIAVRAVAGTEVQYTVTMCDPDEVRDYYAGEMADTVRKVKARQLNDGCLTFALATDIHYRSSNDGPVLAPYAALAMGANMKEFARMVRLDNVVCLGDVVDGLSTAFQSCCDADDMMRVFSGVGRPLINVVGNHDDNRYYSSGNGDRIFTEQEIVSNFIVPVDERTSIGGAMSGCNYYRDIERNRIRLIVLMGISFSGTYSYSSETQTWLTETLSSMETGWKAIIFTHVPPLAAQSWSGTQYSGGTDIASIVEEAGDSVICMFEGHTHLDNTFMTPYCTVMSSCQKCYNIADLTGAPEDSVFPTRAAGDYREDLWNAVVVDTADSIVNVIRFGAGNDRYIHYTPVTVAAGSSTTLSPDVITASSWEVRSSESSYISISDGAVTVDASAPSGSRLTARAADADGNTEIWAIEVS